MSARIVLAGAAALALIAAAGGGVWWGRTHGRASVADDAGARVPGRRVLYWYDPMNPALHFDRPGRSPLMDMPLEPRFADEAGAQGIAIAPGVRQNLGMRTVVVKRATLAAAVRVPGTIDWDLRQERIVSARVDSIVDRLYVRAPFEAVRAGQPLARVIAPAWNVAIAEADALRQAHSASARALQSASQSRLRVLGMPAGTGARQGGLVLTSPVTGVVSEIGVREGQSAPAGTLMFRVNGTATVWLEAALPQADLAGIAPGTPVDAVVDARPGQVVRGRVESLLPQIDAASRTQRARIVLDNPDGLLVPGMFAQVTLRPQAGVQRPLVPTDALIDDGTQARVIVLGGDDRFRPVPVRTGRSGDGMTEILAGLEGGERIVASGQFLIDSEAGLSGALDRLNATPPAGRAEPSSEAHGQAVPVVPDANAPDAVRHDRHAGHTPDQPR